MHYWTIKLSTCIEFLSTIQYTSFQTLSMCYISFSHLGVFKESVVLYVSLKCTLVFVRISKQLLKTIGYLWILDTPKQAQPLTNYWREINYQSVLDSHYSMPLCLNKMCLLIDFEQKVIGTVSLLGYREREREERAPNSLNLKKKPLNHIHFSGKYEIKC